ncbi:MAG: biotin transporter BioY [Desulfurococcus sp.]|nr:biotin transporter BioY [Desulfurococcus sp.]
MKAEYSKLALAAFTTSLTAVLAQIRFNVGPIPYTMQNMGVVMAGLLLPPAYATLSMGLYLLLIALGLPLASGFTGGLAVVLGYTGGYLAGFVIASPLMSILTRFYLRRKSVKLSQIGKREVIVLLAISLIAVLPVYFLGFLVFSLYAIPGSKLYSWSSSVSSWIGLNGDSRILVLLVSSVLIFIPQDLFMDHLLAIVSSRAIAKLLEARGIRVD